MSETFKGKSIGGSGTEGCTAAIDASRCFCLSAATSFHVAPDSMVTRACAMDIRYWMLCDLIIREIIEYIVRTTAEDETVNLSNAKYGLVQGFYRGGPLPT